MISSSTLATYNRIAQMKAAIDTFISQAVMANSDITTALSETLSSSGEIPEGNKIDLKRIGNIIDTLS